MHLYFTLQQVTILASVSWMQRKWWSLLRNGTECQTRESVAKTHPFSTGWSHANHSFNTYWSQAGHVLVTVSTHIGYRLTHTSHRLVSYSANCIFLFVICKAFCNPCNNISDHLAHYTIFFSFVRIPNFDIIFC